MRFTLYDLTDDAPVTCYLAQGYEGIMRNAWGKVAVVEGLVRRNPRTGSPVVVREITAVDVIREFSSEPEAFFREAAGVVPIGADEVLTPEEAIRRIREAGSQSDAQ